MRRTLHLAAAALAAALVLAACGGGDDSDDAPAAPASSSSSSAATTEAAAEQAATAAQFASIVARHRADWYDWAERIDADCVSLDGLAACPLHYLGAEFTADTLLIELSGAHDPSARTYIGEPPAEIADLIAETEAALQTFIDAHKAWSAAGCTDPLDAECGDAFVMTFTHGRVTKQLDAWEPYL